MSAADLIRRARALPPGEWAVLAEAAALAVVVETSLHVRPLSRVVARCQGATPHRVPWPPATAGRLAQLVCWPYRALPLPSSCLRRSLVLAWLLRRRGLEATIRFGVRKTASGIEAHAWVACDGVSLDAPSGERFEPLGASAALPLSRSVRWLP